MLFLILLLAVLGILLILAGIRKTSVNALVRSVIRA